MEKEELLLWITKLSDMQKDPKMINRIYPNEFSEILRHFGNWESALSEANWESALSEANKALLLNIEGRKCLREEKCSCGADRPPPPCGCCG
jgi:predicted GTPase